MTLVEMVGIVAVAFGMGWIALHVSGGGHSGPHF